MIDTCRVEHALPFAKPRFKLSLIAAFLIAQVSCNAMTSEHMATTKLNQGMRLLPEYSDHGFEYVFHSPSGKWVGRECQVRVRQARKLPDPLAPPGQNELLSFSLIGGLSAGSASVTGGIRNIQRFGDWRWWWLNMPVGDHDLKTPQKLGVQVFWPEAGGKPRLAEAMELFELPPIDGQPPETWTGWRGPDALRPGEMAWHDELYRQEPSALTPADLAFPFEIRCRAGLWETPYRRRKAP